MTVYLWTRKMFDEATATWALFCQLVCWFNFYCLVRPFSNSLETVFTVLAFLYWPWQHIRGSNRLLSLCFAALATIIRPTSGILWLYLGISYLVHGCQDRTRLILLHVLPVSVVSITFMMVVDFYGYGEWVNVPLNFLKFNVLEVRTFAVPSTGSFIFLLTGKESSLWRTPMALVLFQRSALHHRNHPPSTGFWIIDKKSPAALRSCFCHYDL